MGKVVINSDSKLVILDLNKDGTLNKEVLRKKMLAYRNAIKVFTIINPNNPSGTLWNQDEIEKIAECLTDIDIVIEDVTFTGITKKKLHKTLYNYYDDSLTGYFTAGSFQKCDHPALADKVITFYSPSKECSPESRISCFAASHLSLDNFVKYGFKVDDHVSSFNFPDICQKVAIENLQNKDIVVKNILYYQKRFNQVKVMIHQFNVVLSSKFQTENNIFIKLTPEKYEATNVATLECSGFKGLNLKGINIAELSSSGLSSKTIESSTMQNDINVFQAFAYYAKAGLIPGSANYTGSDKMQLRIVLGEERESYYGLEKGLLNLAKNLTKNPVRNNQFGSAINIPQNTVVKAFNLGGL